MRRIGLVQALLTGMLVTLMLGGCPLRYEFLFPPLEVVEQVELERYAGKWYEIAKYPVAFQAGCDGATAEYTPRADGKIDVLNSCQPLDGGPLDTILGYAEVADPTTNAKLNVYFAEAPFGAPYWIIELGADYDYAVVGEPSRSFLWILSRTPTMEESLYQEILDRLPAWGYDASRLVRSNHEAAAE